MLDLITRLSWTLRWWCASRPIVTGRVTNVTLSSAWRSSGHFVLVMRAAGFRMLR